MVITQLSAHKPFGAGEAPRQRFRRLDQPDSEVRFATVQDLQDGPVVLWSNIEQLYQFDGRVKYVVDGNYLIEKKVGSDMRIINPEMIQAYTDKILEIALDDEQPGDHGPKTPAAAPPIIRVDDKPGSSPLSDSNPSKSSDLTSSEPSSSSSSLFLPPVTKEYREVSLPSPSLTLSPVATAARRMLKDYPDASARASSLFTCSRSHFRHQVEHAHKDTSSRLPSEACAERRLGQLDLRSTSHPSFCHRPSHRCQQTFVFEGASCPIFNTSSPLHEPSSSLSSSSRGSISIYSTTTTMGAIDDDDYLVSPRYDDHLRSDRDSIPLLEGKPSFWPSYPLSSSSSLNPGSSLIHLPPKKRSARFTNTTTHELCINQSLLSNHVTENRFLSPSTSRMQESFSQQSDEYTSKLFLDDELSPLFD
ncbi:hypothetical protein EC991_004128 [Linnemannia zychae]|nr:hypothetical protein EC991_004128 [Linnemannia zychae]